MYETQYSYPYAEEIEAIFAAAPNTDPKIPRPISILSDLFKVKRAKSYNAKSKSAAVHARKQKSVVTKFLKKKKKALRNIFNRKEPRQVQGHDLFEKPSPPSPINDEHLSEPHIYVVADVENYLDATPITEHDSIGADSLSTSSIHSSDDNYPLYPQTSGNNLLDAKIIEGRTRDGTWIKTDLTSFGTFKCAKSINDNNRFDENRSITISDENEGTDLSLTSFVTVDENMNEISNSRSNASLRRKLLFDRSSSGFSSDSNDERPTKYSLSSEASFSDEAISTSFDSAEKSILSESSGIVELDNTISLLSAAVACVKKRICTPYRIKKGGKNQMIPITTNTQLDRLTLLSAIRCTPTTKNYQASLDVVASTRSLHGKSTDTKSPSISKKVLQQISRIRKTAMSFVTASPRSMSIFV